MEISQKQVTEDILALLNSLKNTMWEVAEDMGITRVQLFAIYSIHNRGELGMGQVADVLHCDPSNVTGIVDRLVSQELVVRRECAYDRRIKTLSLTEKGRQLAQTLEDAMPMKLGCNCLTPEERLTLHQLIRKSLSASGRHDQQPPNYSQTTADAKPKAAQK